MLKLLWHLGTAICLIATLPATAQAMQHDCSPGYVQGQFFALGKGAYFLAAKLTHEQKLPDGSYIRSFATAHFARDGQGRTFSENISGCSLDVNGKAHENYTVFVNDPSGKTMMWNVGYPIFRGKVVRITHRGSNKNLTPEQLADQAEVRKEAKTFQLPPNEFKSEDLGTRNIAGVVTHGTRRTRTIPPGQEGNEVILQSVSETWTSDTYGILAKSDEDPRTGKTGYEVTSLTAGEPDPSWFAPPADYRIEDTNPTTLTAP